MIDSTKDFVTRYLIAGTWFYFTILYGWLTANLILGDRVGLVGLVTSLSVYLFIPLPIAAIVGLITRRKDMIGGAILGLAIFLWFWGSLFMPRPTSPLNTSNPHQPLTVMTYNVLGMHEFTSPVIDVIREVNADVVCLQEVNPVLAMVLQTELSNEYPYQILDPRKGVEGMGTISRYPIRLTGEQLPMGWVGVPQILELDFDEISVTLINFHTYPYNFHSKEIFRDLNKKRLAQAQILADFAEETTNPLILAGDANTSPLNETYRTILRSPLEDSWREAGFGFGHTFPGSNLPGSSRPSIGDWNVPQWLTRIDYIFHSPHWDVISVELAPFDGVSDHRGVVARLSVTREQ